eukprot:4671015-Pleurochrysis_carterae.AAC.1
MDGEAGTVCLKGTAAVVITLVFRSLGVSPQNFTLQEGNSLRGSCLLFADFSMVGRHAWPRAISVANVEEVDSKAALKRFVNQAAKNCDRLPCYEMQRGTA